MNIASKLGMNIYSCSLKSKSSMFLLFTLLLMLLPKNKVSSQTYVYFQGSPSADYYDFSWMELTSPSELERKGADLRKFPVETATVPVFGMNSLRLSWKSASGGDWVAITAGQNWTEHDLTKSDTLMFWLYSVEGIQSSGLPRIFMEDINNVKTTKHFFSAYCDSLKAGVWIKVVIPMKLFLNAGDPVDFTKIKTVGFAQSIADNLHHTLFIDQVMVFTGDSLSNPVSKPAELTARGYDCHIELKWKANPEINLGGYLVQRSLDSGKTFTTIKITGKDEHYYIDWVKSYGYGVEFYYRVLALNAFFNPSMPSDAAFTSTKTLTDEEFLDMVQQYTFRYFWDFAEPNSGMVGDRNTSGSVVTTGGSGFGIMAILVGINRGFITRGQGTERILKILGFLEKADRFHGAWPHFIDGSTGKVVPFSTYDDGGDLVETGFLVEGLLSARQFFNQNTPEEQSVVQKITTLWEGVEWDWYRQNNSNVLYWHWSPNFNWKINMQIRGWNEAAIVYMLAIASPAHSVPASLWANGWAGEPYYLNGKSFMGYKLDVGWDYGGPLFFAHYSFMGFDPRNKKDSYTNYYRNNQHHTLINRAYCIANPLHYAGYETDCWGLTASDDPDGYSVHEPAAGRDNGTISPTAALSSMPYTPKESLNALKFLYRAHGDKIWGWMGFYDAFNLNRNWFADSYLAIDQGPIINMIENSRSQLLWNNFMANPEIQPMLQSVGFTEDMTGIEKLSNTDRLIIYPNPAENSQVMIIFNSTSPAVVDLSLFDIQGRLIATLVKGKSLSIGEQSLSLSNLKLSSGIYIVRLTSPDFSPQSYKLIIM